MITEWIKEKKQDIEDYQRRIKELQPEKRSK